jgi:hypothetical protein
LDLLKSKTALDDFGINYAINVIGENYESIKQTTTNFEVTQFPKTIVLGKDGKIAAVNLQSLEDYKSMIDSLLV